MQIYTEFGFVSTVFGKLDKRTKHFGALINIVNLESFCRKIAVYGLIQYVSLFIRIYANISIFLKELQHLPTFMR